MHEDENLKLKEVRDLESVPQLAAGEVLSAGGDGEIQSSLCGSAGRAETQEEHSHGCPWKKVKKQLDGHRVETLKPLKDKYHWSSRERSIISSLFVTRVINVSYGYNACRLVIMLLLCIWSPSVHPLSETSYPFQGHGAAGARSQLTLGDIKKNFKWTQCVVERAHPRAKCS